MSSTHTYGRNRQSIADIEREIEDLFRNHPKSTLSEDDEPIIPGDALVDILQTFSQNHDALELMTKEEEGLLIQLIESNPGLAVTPQVLLQFIAMRTTMNPNPSPEDALSDDGEEPERKSRSEERVEYEYDSRSRSSSRGSIGTSVYRPPSRPSSRGPSVPPKTPVHDSPFDVSRRQRTTPLVNAPSSWTRRPPPQRRRSDAGLSGQSVSDSESSVSSPPIAYTRSQGSVSGRARAPSNPVSPNPYDTRDSGRGAPSPISIGSPSFGSVSRPHSRAQSQPQGHFNLDGFAMRHGSISPDDGDYYHQHELATGLMSPPQSDLELSETSFGDEEHLVGRISSLPMPRRSDSDSDDDSDGDDPTLGLVHERMPTASTISLDMAERLDALQRINDELRRKLYDTEESLQKRLSEREAEIEDMQQRLDEMKSELTVTKRQEKELRAKERTSFAQIQALEQNVTQLAKSLENSRQAYQNLNFQYGEQCGESQRYRDLLVQRDQEIQQLKDTYGLQALDLRKWEAEQEQWLGRVKDLEEELQAAQKTQAALDEQKQENMMLKETIDRLRFEMDEMRSHAASGLNASGGASANSTISRSLGAELSKLQNAGWEKEEAVPEGNAEQKEEEETDDDSEDEDVVQTIITRTKRKVGSRGKKIETIKLDEVKEYSDASVQHELATRTFCMQTDPEPRPRVASLSVQTNETPCASMSIQTDPEPMSTPVATVEMNIQTDLESSAAVPPHSDEDDEALASSSSTVLPPTPKPQGLAQLHPHPHDLPPSYNQVAGQDQDELAIRVANETLKKWHKGLKLPIEPVPGGISEDAIEDWKALKEELGVECSAIERIVEGSERTGLPRSSKTPRRNRFYNIYNTYVYGDKAGGPSGPLSYGQFLFCIGASAAVAFLVGSSMAPQYSIPGGATYYDRAAWSSFNSIQAVGEGFPGDGSTAFWGFLGKIGGGAARTLQGWPT